MSKGCGLIQFPHWVEGSAMMGPRQEAQPALFYEFSLEDHVPQSHLLRSIKRFVDLSGIRSWLAGICSHGGRPSVDPGPLIRMLLVGYCFGIRSERRLCEEVHLKLACRWFCRLDLSDRVPDHSTFSKNRHGRFRESELLRHSFDTTVGRCIEEGLVSGQWMAVDAPRAVREYLDVLDEAAFGAASEVQPKFTSHSDPASQWTAARKGPAFFSYSDNNLIDMDHGVIVDVEATRSIRQAEVSSTKTMLERVKARFDLHPERLIADTAYGTAPMLGWLVERKTAPHIPVFDKSERIDGTWGRADFGWDAENDHHICPEGQTLKPFRRNYSAPNRGPTGQGSAKYRALKLTCQACPSKAECCPDADARSIPREEQEDARQVARDIAKTEQYVISMKLRKKVKMLFAHLRRILGLNRLRLRGPRGANDEFLLAATAQILRKLAEVLPASQQPRKA
ncbi:transposase IS4 family protein [Citreicella sp. SE45]|nr:transposase IS4 family protein [Citreicella sp. SE45]